MKLNNKYYLLRHGQAVSNAKNIVSCWPEKLYNPLTQKGVRKIESVAKKIKNKKIDLIFVSPLLRTQQTAEIVAKDLAIKPKIDKRLRELDFGIFNGEPAEDFMEYFKSKKERINRPAPRGESYMHIFKRVLSFFKEINKKYKDKNILIVSHQSPLLLLLGEVHKNSISESMDGLVNVTGEKKIVTGQLIELN